MHAGICAGRAEPSTSAEPVPTAIQFYSLANEAGPGQRATKGDKRERPVQKVRGRRTRFPGSGTPDGERAEDRPNEGATSATAASAPEPK